MKEITLTKGHKAIVDDDDFDSVSMYNWCAYVPFPGGLGALRLHQFPTRN